MIDPVIFNGKTYDRKELLSFVQQCNCDPETLAPLTLRQVQSAIKPNSALKKKIDGMNYPIYIHFLYIHFSFPDYLKDNPTRIGT